MTWFHGQANRALHMNAHSVAMFATRIAYRYVHSGGVHGARDALSPGFMATSRICKSGRLAKTSGSGPRSSLPGMSSCTTDAPPAEQGSAEESCAYPGNSAQHTTPTQSQQDALLFQA